ncbi:MAG: hypothetical protein WB992_21730 [Bryobacteraceae bacterium]
MRSRCVIAALYCVIARVAQIESSQDLIERLTPQQKQQFDLASQAFNSQHYADALVGFKDLILLYNGRLSQAKLLPKPSSIRTLSPGCA